jgi:hypothetical protein
MQLADDVIFSHSEHPYPRSHPGFDGRQKAGRDPVSNPLPNGIPLQVNSTILSISDRYANKNKGLEVVTSREM